MYSDMDSGKVLCPLCKENWLLHNNGAQVKDTLQLHCNTQQRRAGD
jgi:predicted  nucleic acid-binding Zn ribbon protein